jgi:cell division septal protein FtsQ
VLLTLAILAVPTVVYAWGRSSSSFDIAVIRVSGTHLVPAKKTLRLLQKTYVGDNLFTVTANDVRETLESQSFVAAVTVDRDFPDTLEVGIREYEPAAYALAGSRWYVLDERGHVICTASEAVAQLGKVSTRTQAAATPEAAASSDADAAATEGAVGDLAVPDDEAAADASATGDKAAAESGGLTARLVAGPPDAALSLPRISVSGRVRDGERLTGEATAQKLAVVTALPNSYRRRLAAVEEEDGQLTLRFEDGLVAAWGDAGRTLAKTVALRTVLAEYEEAGKTCTQIDVSLPDRTLARPILH